MNEFIGLVLFTIFVTSAAAALIVSLSYSKLTKFAIIALSGTVMIAQGSRMISQFILNPGSSYIPNLFDVFFDWMTLILFGAFVAYFGFLEFYRKEKEILNKK